MDNAYEHLIKHAIVTEEDVLYEVSLPNSPTPARGVYLRRSGEVDHVTQTNVKVLKIINYFFLVGV